jgi:hypothetical protein
MLINIMVAAVAADPAVALKPHNNLVPVCKITIRLLHRYAPSIGLWTD